jgi:hypothetical protein
MLSLLNAFRISDCIMFFLQYACRKTLADCQSMMRGRFAKIEECDLLKPSK